MTWIVNVEHASLLSDGIYMAAAFYRECWWLPAGERCRGCTPFWFWLAYAYVMCTEQSLPLCQHREAAPDSCERDSHLSSAMADCLVPFQTVLKSIVASLVWAELRLRQTWQVGWWFAVATVVSPRDSSLKGAKRDYDSFSSFMFELADTKGAGSMWQPPDLAALSLTVQIIWSIGHKQTFSWTLFVSLVVLDSSVVQSRWISEVLKVMPLLSALPSLDAGTPTPTSRLSRAAFRFPTASLG